MANLDWKNIVNKVISWGFSATFAILGIVLMALHSQIDLPIYAGLTVALVGVLIYAITTIIENKVKQVVADNKTLAAKIIELEQKIDELTKTLNEKNFANKQLIDENKRKQAKIDKLESCN